MGIGWEKMVSNEEIKKRLEIQREGLPPEDENVCPQCGTANEAHATFCMECGKKISKNAHNNTNRVNETKGIFDESNLTNQSKEEILDDLDTNIETYSDESILGYITTNNFNRHLNAPVLGMEHEYFTLFFTTNRLVIIETIQFAGSDRLFSLGFGAMGIIPAMERGKQALKIAEKLSKMTPHEIFSSDMPCMSIPYSKIKRIRGKNVSRLGSVLISGGKIEIETDENVIKYPLNSISKGIGFGKIVYPDLGFLHNVEPLHDKVYIK